VTSYVRATTLFGLFIGSLLAQLLVSIIELEYFWLNVISLADVSIAFVIALFLPMPKTTLFFFVPPDELLTYEERPPDETQGTSFHSDNCAENVNEIQGVNSTELVMMS